jgi:hypothetical protein
MPWGWAAAAAAVVSAVGAIAQGQAAAQQGKYQSEVMRQQAERERQEAAVREDDYRRQASRDMATRRALMGASGVDSGTGSPLMVSEDMIGEAEYQALRIRSGGEVQATRLEQQAQLARMAGSNAQSGSYFRAGASLLQGAGYGYGAYNKAPAPRGPNPNNLWEGY